MTISQQHLHAALTCLAGKFPRTFVLEQYQPHHPLKVGISNDLAARCPELNRRHRGAALAAYTRRVMYLQGMVAGTARLDLDGAPAGEVSAGDAAHAAARLARILAARGALVPAEPAPKQRPVLRLPASRQQRE